MAVGRSLGRSGRDIELSLEAGGAAAKPAAYHALPAARHGRAVLVLGESDALDDFARDACDRLARAGFVALAPDLAGTAGADALLAACVRFLLDHAASDGARVGAVGFGRGGARALELLTREARVGCAIDFYGTPEPGAKPGGRAGAPALVIFGADDARVRDGSARELVGRLPGARLRIEAGAGDGFMNEARADRHAAAAAASAWDAAIAFLGASL
jgi:carboxymethylenebutenolidase